MPVNDVSTPEGKKIIQTEKRPPARILALDEWIKRYVAEHGEVYLDYFSATVDEHGWLKAELTNDGLHPNGKSYEVMAPLAEKPIQEALGHKP